MTIKGIMRVFKLKDRYEYDANLKILTIYDSIPTKTFVELKAALKSQNIELNNLVVIKKTPYSVNYKGICRY